MELKPYAGRARESRRRAFNRTFMELKLKKRCCILDLDKAFNRTFMELKPQSGQNESGASRFF